MAWLGIFVFQTLGFASHYIQTDRLFVITLCSAGHWSTWWWHLFIHV